HYGFRRAKFRHERTRVVANWSLRGLPYIAHAGAGRLHGEGLCGRTNFPRTVAWASGTAAVPVRGGRRQSRDALDELRGRAARVQLVGFPRCPRASSLPGLAAAESAEPSERSAPTGPQYGGQLHDEHELAGVFGRIDLGLSGANARPSGAKLP